MKILYITPTIYDEGGVAKALSIKTNYWVNKCNYKVSFLTSNNLHTNFFHPFPDTIEVIDIKSKGLKLLKILSYYKQIKQQIELINPDVIIICDFGWKGFCFNLFVSTKIPVVFEIHGSKYNETKKIQSNLIIKIRANFRSCLLKTFSNLVFLSKESKNEWNLKGEIIPNPIENLDTEKALLLNKKAICLARHSYEKGIDRLIKIWKQVAQVNPDWQLEIYGDGIYFEENFQKIKKLQLVDKIKLLKPQKDIDKKYKEASIYLMTSRQEAFPMVLLEAMNYGLPIVAYNCPIGPRAIITNKVDGFLIEDGNTNEFVTVVNSLISNSKKRIDVGNTAHQSIKKYNVEIIMTHWLNYLQKLVKVPNL